MLKHGLTKKLQKSRLIKKLKDVNTASRISKQTNDKLRNQIRQQQQFISQHQQDIISRSA